MKEAFEIARIIQKSLKGQLSESEERQLSDWRKASGENERAFQRMISEDFYTVEMEKVETYDYRVAYGRFLQRKYQQRRKRKFLINVVRVAAVALPFIIALVLYVGLNRDEEQTLRPSLATNILPGTSKAVLTLANGQMIPLGKEAADSTIITDGAQINASGSGVTYASGGESESIVYNKLEIPRGGEFCLTLSDGTRVWLNSETSIQYPVAFGAKERRVFVQGEAYFEVSRNESKPFVVEVEDKEVRVLGTQFNTSDYKGSFVTTLVSGKVSCTYENQEIELQPGEQAITSKHEAMEKRKVNVAEYIGWKDGLYIFKRRSLGSIMNELARWYDIEVVYKDEGLKNILFTGNLKRYDTINTFMKIIKRSGDINYRIEGKTIILYK